MLTEAQRLFRSSGIGQIQRPLERPIQITGALILHKGQVGQGIIKLKQGQRSLSSVFAVPAVIFVSFTGGIQVIHGGIEALAFQVNFCQVKPQ